MEVAEDSTLDSETRSYAVLILGELVSQGRKFSEQTLVKLLESDDRFVARDALYALSKSDDQGRHREKYLARCKKGAPEAFEAVSHWLSADTITQMQLIISSNSGEHTPESTIRLSAQTVLKRMELLASAELEPRLESILEGTSSKESDWFPWALKVARAKSALGFNLQTALRRRVDTGLAREHELASQELGSRGVDVDSEFATNASWMLDRYFDDALVAYAASGGALSELEKKRLRTFGYACDPRQRLQELLVAAK